MRRIVTVRVPRVRSACISALHSPSNPPPERRPRVSGALRRVQASTHCSIMYSYCSSFRHFRHFRLLVFRHHLPAPRAVPRTVPAARHQNKYNGAVCAPPLGAHRGGLPRAAAAVAARRLLPALPPSGSDPRGPARGARHTPQPNPSAHAPVEQRDVPARGAGARPTTGQDLRPRFDPPR